MTDNAPFEHEGLLDQAFGTDGWNYRRVDDDDPSSSEMIVETPDGEFIGMDLAGALEHAVTELDLR
jgi:hypothetical protein